MNHNFSFPILLPLLPTVLFVALFTAPLASSIGHAQGLHIALPEPAWEIDSHTSPLTEREAALTPEEENLAIELRPLLRGNQYQQAVEVLENSDKSHFSPAMYFVLGQLYLSLGDYDKAQSAYLSTVELMPDFLRAHRGLGIVYLQQGDLEKARVHITRAISLGAYDAQIFGQLSYINLQSHKPWNAISGYQQAMFLEPDNKQWQQGLLYALVDAGDYLAARALLEDLLEQQPENTTLWLQLSNLSLNTQDETAALTGLEMALRLGDNNIDNTLIAGRLHLQHGSLDRGIELLESIVSYSDTAAYEQLIQTLISLEQRSQWPQLERLVLKIQENTEHLSDSQHSQLLVSLSKLSLRNGNNQQAKSELESSLELNPSNGRALLNFAELLEEENPVQSSLLLSRAQALPEFRERALINHAQLSISQNLYDEALRLLIKVVEENPTRTDITNSITTLQRIVTNQSFNNN